jgi:hypothetical protein
VEIREEKNEAATAAEKSHEQSWRSQQIKQKGEIKIEFQFIHKRGKEGNVAKSEKYIFYWFFVLLVYFFVEFWSFFQYLTKN